MKNVTRNVSQKPEVIKNYIKVAKTRKEKCHRMITNQK